MDYINTPSSLIYKYRDNLNDFGVQIPGTVNNYLFSQMRRMTLLRAGNAKEIALQCFNNAYYICTLIQLEEFPDLCIDKYEKKLLEVEIPFLDDVCAASMGLVCKLLPAYDEQWKQEENPLMESICHWFSHNRWMSSYARASFDSIVSICNTEGFLLPTSEFAPRDIVEAIEEVGKDKTHLLVKGVEYICERLACIDDPQRRLYGADLTIAYLNNFLQDTYEEYGYDPKTNSFEPAEYGTFGAEPDFEESFWRDVNIIKETIEYITEHYPTKDDDSMEKTAEPSQILETKNLQTIIWELESKLTLQEKQQIEANKINSQHATRIKELEAEVIHIKDLEADLEELRKWKQLSRDQVALFCHALAEYCQFVQKTKLDDIAPMAHELFGIGKKSAYNLMVSGYSKEDREHVAKIFETIWPPFADFIKNTFDKKEL